MKITTIKTKLMLGLLFLFIVIISFGGLGIYFVNRLSSDAGKILKDNQISVEYCGQMLKALDQIQEDPSQIAVFEKNLRLEENNITEPGEFQATAQVRALFEQLKKNPAAFTQFREMHKAIFKIDDVNEIAIIHKNAKAVATARQATAWLTIIVTILSLAAFSFIINFPGIISKPIKELNAGILEIAGKNYSARVHLKQQDEFGSLAETFNTMAGKLDEYEHSNLAEIKAEKGRIEAIINKMNDGIIGFNNRNEILFLNSAAEGLFGLREKDITGKYAADIAIQNDLLRTVLQNETSKQLKIYLDNKESFFVQESISIQTDGITWGRVIILRNITPYKELDAAKTNFIATISHELKIPLFAIAMSTQLLEDKRIGELNNDQAEILGTIAKNTERLLKITGELLNLSQIETGQIQLKKEPVLPETLIMKAVQAVKQQAGQKNITIHECVAKKLPPVNLDDEKTIWVLINFLNNAIKFSAEQSTVAIMATQERDIVQFSVADQGRGIEEQYVSRVFEKYFQVPGSNEKSGTGLGLSISKEFIEAQGGKIWVNSTFGEGSTFGFNILVNA
ncbi:ATP-binding protein [Mucilaginibacter sp. SMC90]|uniref:ATP-binding protein n=1 Tax=Mucilaginibacter sp. SMC90 TaxID=2929803 RepID=UPI001FB1D406|nr:ATP-binding protein [Mucilaginibacter sp. SMC90]UOE46565.1 ATP-binding protein [Mucilaginibacter sp. SMC90]